MLNVQRLKVLREVVARGSFSEAASALNYTQSAISQAIATLESEAGVPLLERTVAGSGRRRPESVSTPTRGGS